MKLLFAILVLPASLALVHCGGDGGSSGTTGTGGAGGDGTSTSSTGSGAPTFMCGTMNSKMLSCKIGVEFCKEQDSAVSSDFTCLPIPASCATGDLCQCPDLAPGCALGDGPESFSCGKDDDGNYSVGCPG